MKDGFLTHIGVWGQRHYNYLKKHSPTVIIVMRMKGTLEQYLTDMNRDTQETYDMMIRQYAEIEGVTEDLKRSDQMGYTRRMNSIRNRVEEFVLSDLVNAYKHRAADIVTCLRLIAFNALIRR